MVCVLRFKPTTKSVWLLGSFVSVLALLALSPTASAQSSVGAPLNAAAGRSLTDAVRQNENELIAREVLDGAAGVAGGDGRGTGGSTGALGFNAYSTGRLRGSSHDGLRPPSDTNFAFKTQEASGFANVVATLPGTVLGGQIKISGFAGYNQLSLKLKSNAIAVLDPDQFGEASNGSMIAGGTVLWASQGVYALATVVGMWGETRLIDGVDDCGPCTVNRYKFDTAGLIGTMTTGRVFDLPGLAGAKLDLRGSLGYTRNNSDPFLNINKGGGDVEQRYSFSTWNGTASATLFTTLAMPNNAVLRPYIQGYLRQEWRYRNIIDATEPGADTVRTILGQKHLYGGVDIGATYAIDKTTFGAAVYYEASGDDRTFGGRIGMSWKLN